MNHCKLLIDCGATSAKVVVVGKKIEFYEIVGFNPHHHEWADFRQALHSLKQSLALTAIDELKFYGTGMGQEVYSIEMQSVLSKTFELPKEKIEVYSDLMVCAHAAFEGKPVIIGILGTGSNIGYFDGELLSRRTPSLGYILGDEGSGVDIGRHVLKAYMYGDLPSIVKTKIDERINLSLDYVLDQTYAKNDLRSLASQLAPIASEFRHLPFLKNLIKDSLSNFISMRLVPECADRALDTKIVMFGSVAESFKDFLENLIKVSLGRSLSIYKSPLNVLIEKNKHN